MQQAILKRTFLKNPPALRAKETLDGFWFWKTRKDLGLSQNQVAKELGISLADIRAIESGQYPIRAWTHAFMQRVIKYQRNHGIGTAADPMG